MKGNIERNIKTFSYFKIIMDSAIKNATKKELGAFYERMIGMVFSAFCLEAFLNYLLEEKVKNYDHSIKETPQEKLIKICAHINYQADMENEPFCYFSTIFDYRDLITHAKYFKTTATKYVNNEGELLKSTQPLWKKMTTQQNCVRFVNNAIEMIQKLRIPAGISRDPFISLEVSSYGLEEMN